MIGNTHTSKVKEKMPSEIAIKVSNLSKCYHIYDKPNDRLKQFIVPKLCKAIPPLRKLFTTSHSSILNPQSSVPEFYKEFWALKDVSFEIKKGETVGIIGRNGSGKSTLLQMICGTLNPTGGSIQTNGRIAALLELGSGFNPEFTGRENVYMNAAVLGLSREETEARFDDIAAFADIGDFIDQPVKVYSSGMMVRLAFAVQVCVEPEILIVDEALAVGDALFQKRCFERMEKLRSNGTTLLFVSHDQESVRTLTSRAIFLHHGVVQCIGNSAEILLEYRKLLHEEEARALNKSALHLKEKATQARAARERLQVSTKITKPDAATVDGYSASSSGRLDTMSFGDMEAEVLKVKIFNVHGEECTHFDPRDAIRIVVECVSHTDLEHLNMALRIRNKEGVKIYSWGTLNQDMSIRAGLVEGDVFWNRSFGAGQRFSVKFDFICGLGPNLYEIQAAITKEGKPYYAEQRMLHWMDEAAFFTVTTEPSAYHFGGVVDLIMTSQYQEIVQ